MENLDVLEVHNNYSDIYEGYRLIGSYQLYVPFYELEVTYEYFTKTRLSLVEEYICKCIERGINNIKEISFVIAIDEDIINFYVNQLNKLNYLIISDNNIKLTDEAKVLYKELMKKTLEKDNLSLVFDTLNGRYLINNESKESHKYYSLKEVIGNEDAIILEPRVLEDENYINNIASIINNGQLDNRKSRNIKVQDEKKILYHNTTLLIFERDDKYKMLCYDNCGVNGIDNSITEKLQELFENGSLYEVINENLNIKGKTLSHILNNYERELEIEEDEDIKAILYEIKETVKEADNLEYIMNYDIRKKFLNYLENAKESLYIISPWMNNYIINSDFIKKLENLLDKGVRVRIIYGISSKDEIKEDFRNKNTDSIAKKLRDMAKPYGELFKISHGQTHEKLVICDRKYYINGSFNFLSYSGESDGKFRNEGSTYSENKKLIDKTIKLRFDE